MTIRLDGDLAGEFATRLTIDRSRWATTAGSAGSSAAFSKVPIQVNVNINGPFRSLIQMAKAFKDPRRVIARCFRSRCDARASPSRSAASRKQEKQTQTPATEQVDVATPPHHQARNDHDETHMRARRLPQPRCAAPLASCISVKAPDKPIEINLKSISQEVSFACSRTCSS